MTTGTEWRDAVGRNWAENYRLTDRAFSGLTERLLARIGGLGDRSMLDVGCGAGELSLAVGRVVTVVTEAVGTALMAGGRMPSPRKESEVSLMIIAGMATMMPYTSVVPMSAPNIGTMAEGEGCGGRKPCVTDSAASNNRDHLPIFIPLLGSPGYNPISLLQPDPPEPDLCQSPGFCADIPRG